MADRAWTGSTSTDFNDAGNWDGAVPIDGDNLKYTGPVANSCTVNMDQGGKDFPLIYVDESYTGTVGSTGTPLICAADLIVVNGGAGFYCVSDKNGAALKIDEVRIAPKNPNTPVEIGSNSADAGEVDKIICLSGNVIARSDILFGASALVETGWRNSMSNDVKLTIQAGADTLPTLETHGGIVSVNNLITNFRGYNTRVTVDTTHILNADFYDCGLVAWNDATASGDGVTVKLHGNTLLDLKRNARTKVLSTVWAFPGSRIEKDSNLHTFTAFNDLRLLQ